MWSKYISPVLLLSGIVLLGVSVFVGYYVVPFKVREKVAENSKILPGNERFKKWQSLPDNLKLYQRIYLFNVTNPFEVVNGGVPILQEIGPFVFQQKRYKVDIVYNENNGTIFYREKTNYFFRPELTNGSLSDPVTIINLPFVSTAHKAAQVDMITRYAITETLRKYPEEQLYVNTTVGELLFGGYYLPFIKDLAELKGEPILPNNTFGLYYGKNGSDQGTFEIFSGVKNPDKFGDVITWNGKDTLDWWGDDKYCNQINGSDGGVFRPFSTKETVFEMFVPGLCKTFKFEFEKEDEHVKGIPVLKFSVKPSLFASPKTNPENACYCINPGRNYENCPESGVVPLEGCGKGAMVLSQPHFYQGSQIYLNQSKGLNPQKDRHEMALFIETYTSAPARVVMRFQMNVGLKPNKFFRPLKKIPKMVHPVFWIDQTVELPDDSAALLRDKLYLVVNLTKLLVPVGIIAGISSIILSFIAFCLCTNNRAKTKQKEAGGIECVSYNRNGTLPNSEKVVMKANGKLQNGSLVKEKRSSPECDTSQTEDETQPFLNQNGDIKSPSHVNGHANSHEVDKTESGITSNAAKEDERVKNLITSTMGTDSRLNPFPVLTEFSSSSSIGLDSRINMNTLKDIVDATSSYENL